VIILVTKLLLASPVLLMLTFPVPFSHLHLTLCINFLKILTFVMSIGLTVNLRNFQQEILRTENLRDPGLDDAKQFK